ncbi:winged helix-turn-helix domain-containing protein [Paenibacillus wynnii]|uniref:winged helix-turn-helix domain-containing protein n=1 Tax=Paenibacillus wynnii TaxID=268407 RepID=UPI00278D2108|nr:winged helix-turn-helix domain-containing protein [Paenibacillus wynnii]MDQ0194270.1 DNA-binding winged helix-turn-helix (wHTH) protein [Paenibacillus wynnii]
MNPFQMDPSALSVTWNNSTLLFLPKEFALLEYLYLNNGQTLSREQLLNAVWTLEEPTDRTVDDHIYRLRKKLRAWHPMINIETLRGLGYRLQLLKSQHQENPLLHNPTYKEDMRDISDMYLRYGRGDALFALAQNKEIFGFELESPLQVIVDLMQGGVEVLLEEGKLPIEERLFTLLVLYQMIDPSGNRKYLEAALRGKVLSPLLHHEIEVIIYPSILMDWGDLKGAKLKLDALAAEVERQGWDGLIPYVNNMKLEYDLHTQNWSALEKDIVWAEEQWNKYPYLREKGQLLIFKGLALYRSNHKEATHLMNEGISIIKETHFTTHLLRGLQTILYFSKTFGWKELYETYDKEWGRLLVHVGIAEVKDRMDQLLHSYLREYL